MTQQFDAIVIGAGQAGPPLAQQLTQAGMRVALVERKVVGGTCVNTGCMPTKALVASAYAAQLARRGAQYGLELGEVRVAMDKVQQRSHQVTLNARDNVENWLKSMQGLTVFRGHARFESADTVVVDDRRLTADKIFINVGARASVPDLPGLASVDYLTNASMLELREVPRHLVILGGSYIALEFAQMFRRFGARVTVLERGQRLLKREDEDISDEIASILRREDIDVRTGVKVSRIAQDENGVQVYLKEHEQPLVGSHLLIATGRQPNTDDLGLVEAGIAVDERGYIQVDDQLATSVAGVWALGDCNGRGAFTHTAYNDYEIVAANLLHAGQRRVSDRVPGYALYIDPPLARVGVTLAQARELQRPLLAAKRPMSRVGRAVERGETTGFMKVVVDAGTRRILGAAILGVNGDEAIHGIADIMHADVPYTVLQQAVPIHPTVSELLPTLLGSLEPVES